MGFGGRFFLGLKRESRQFLRKKIIAKKARQEYVNSISTFMVGVNVWFGYKAMLRGFSFHEEGV